MDPDLLPPTKHGAANYPAGETYKALDEDGNPRECTVDDICDFIVEYINSDVLGLLSDRLLIIAGTLILNGCLAASLRSLF